MMSELNSLLLIRIENQKFSIFSKRGSLGSIMSFLRNIGILIGYILGASFDYKLVPCISVTIPIAFIIIFMTLPSTPQHYLHKRKPQVRKPVFLKDREPKVDFFDRKRRRHLSTTKVIRKEIKMKMRQFSESSRD